MGQVSNTSESIRVCHVAMGDLWAGAEVHLATLVGDLITRTNVEVSVVIFNDGKLAHELSKRGVPVIIFPEIKWSARVILRELVALCRRHQFHVLHTHKYKDNILGTLAAWRAGIPVVVRTVHGASEPFRGMQAGRIAAYEVLDRIALSKGADRIVAVSSNLAGNLRKAYGDKKVVQIHNGIDLQRTTLRPAGETKALLGIPEDHYVIGTVGRIMPVKGHKYLLRCAQLLLRNRRDIQVVIVGDGPLQYELAQLASELGVERNVHFLGHRDDIDDLIRVMDIFVLPSLHEGIPMVVLEAMALARPIVASKVGGIPEVVHDGMQGLLVAPADPNALAQACMKLLEDRDLANRFGEAARIRVQQEFSAEAMGARTYQLYRELVDNNSRACVG